MGSVHLARPIHTDIGIPSPVVLKTMLGELADRELYLRRFRHEGEVAVAIHSPHVARVYDVGAVGTTLFIVMEYVDGWRFSELLDAMLTKGESADIPTVLELIAGALRGVDAIFRAADAEGRPLASGVYLLRLTDAAGRSATLRATLLK